MPVTTIPISKQELAYVVVNPEDSNDVALEMLRTVVQRRHRNDGWNVTGVDYFSRQPDPEYGNAHRCYGRVTVIKTATVLNRNFDS